jgi:hypothetical protein
MTATTTPPAAMGLAHEEAALPLLESLLASARAWHHEADDALGAISGESRRAEALLRIVLRTERRLATLRRQGAV